MIRAYILNQELADKQLDQMQLSSRPHKLQSTVPESFITAFGGSPSNPQLCCEHCVDFLDHTPAIDGVLLRRGSRHQHGTGQDGDEHPKRSGLWAPQHHSSPFEQPRPLPAME